MVTGLLEARSKWLKKREQKLGDCGRTYGCRARGRDDFAAAGDGPAGGETGVVGVDAWVEGGLAAVGAAPLWAAAAGAGDGWAGDVGVGRAAAVDFAADGLDALPGAGCVAVFVLGTGAVVCDRDGLDDHGEGTVGVVGGTPSPLDCACCVGRVAAGPVAEAHLHGSLRILSVGVGILEDANCLAVDGPDNLAGGPVDGIGAELSLGIGDCVESTTTGSGGDTLAKVV